MKKIVSTILIAAMLLAIIAFPMLAADVPVSVVCESGLVGDTVVVNVTLPAGSNVCGGSFNLVYDNTKLSLVSATAGSLKSDAVVNPTFAANKIRVSFAGITPITAAGNLLVVEFEILGTASGALDITLESLKLSDSTASLIGSTPVDSSICVHSWGAWAITTEPTLTATGEAERICSHDSSHVDTETLPKLDDTATWTVGTYTAPTCAVDGSQAYVSATYGSVIEVIPATGHSWGAWAITAEPTLTATGEAERICAHDSSHVDTKTLPKLDDTATWTVGTYTAPTCTVDGSQAYVSATYGSVIEVIPATGHSWGAWAITTEPTLTATGEAERICAHDSSHIDTETLPKLDDTATWTVGTYTAPTCTVDGSQIYTSAYGTIMAVVPMLGHDFEWIIDKDATILETGLKHEECKVCSFKQNENTEIPKLLAAVYTITFEKNGGSSVSDATLVTGYDGKLSTLPTAARSGNYSFNGWFTQSVGGVAITVDTLYTANTTVYAQWSYLGGSSSGGSGVTQYTVSFDTQGGNKIDSVRVNKNSIVSKPNAPTKDGYVFVDWFTDKDCSALYDFGTNVIKNFTLYAKWVEKKEEPIETENWNHPFDDITEDNWFYDNVKFVYENGLMKGTESNLFSPYMQTTRGMIITILWRLENEPNEGTETFADVAKSAYYSKAVAWGTKNGLVKGYDDDLYRPEQNISRQELAAILYRYSMWSGKDTALDGDITAFSDVSAVDSWALDGITWAVGAGLLQGNEHKQLLPKAFATRAEVAAMFTRYLS